MPTYQIENDNTLFDSNDYSDWSSGSIILGSNGYDLVFARSPIDSSPITNISIYGSNGNDLVFLDTNNSFVTGGNGDDDLLIRAANTFAFGDNGNDTLESSGGLGNTLSGGNGNDLLVSIGGGSGYGPGNTLTGGPGSDSFRLESGSGNLIVRGDAGNDGVVSQGDVLVGPMDVITDYQRGEHIGLRNFEAPADSLAPTRAHQVALVPDPLSNTGENFRPILGGDEYGVFRGTFGGSNSFTVDSEGPDLFVNYQLAPADNDPVGQGSFVLLGVTDEQLVAQAFSPATGTGRAGTPYTTAGTGEGWFGDDQSGTAPPMYADQGSSIYAASLTTADNGTTVVPLVGTQFA